MSRILKTVAAIAATALMSGAAFANCNSSYCTTSSHSSSLAPLGSWSGSHSNSYVGTLSSSTADAVYGTGSISSAYSAYEGGDVEIFGFSGSTASAPSLGINESLQATDCPVSVHNPEGGRVLGCYNVVQPAPQPIAQTSYYQVVRPVVYVRYAVPVAVPHFSGCTVVTHESRYGNRWGSQNGNFGRSCG